MSKETTFLIKGKACELSYELIRCHYKAIRSQRNTEDGSCTIEISKKNAGKLLANPWEYFICNLRLKKWEDVKALKEFK